MVMFGIAIEALCGLIPSLSMLSSNGGKNLVNSSSACSMWSVVLILSDLMSCGTFPKADLMLDLRYLATCQILSLSAMNSSQCFFFCWQIASWYCFTVLFAISSRFIRVYPAHHLSHTQFLQ